MSWLADLERELCGAGVPAGRRRRIVAELRDHLACDPGSEARLGEPAELARRFVDELGTALARRAGIGVFAALAPFGVLVAILFERFAVVNTNIPSGIVLLLVLGVQLAFVGGTLAGLRAWRLRRQAVVPAAEPAVLVRRAALGVTGCALTLAGLGAVATKRFPGVAWSLPALLDATVAVGVASLVAGTCLAVRAARLRPLAAGEAGDLERDLGPLVPGVLRGSPLRIALAVAGAVVLAVAASGAAVSDGIDGLVRGLGDGLLCLGGFAVLCRWLGLRT